MEWNYNKIFHNSFVVWTDNSLGGVIMADARKMYDNFLHQNVTTQREESHPKIISHKQVSTSIHKIYPYKLYKYFHLYLGFNSISL